MLMYRGFDGSGNRVAKVTIGSKRLLPCKMPVYIVLAIKKISLKK